MKKDLEIALEECLDLMTQGESLSACLARYPDQAEELALLLSLAKGIEGLKPAEPLPASVVVRQRRTLLQTASQFAQEEKRPIFSLLSWWPSLSTQPVLAVAAVLALTLVIGGGAVLASGGNLGEALLQLVPGQVREALGLEEEATPVLEMVEVEFTGVIESISEISWVVSGQTVLLDADTVVEGTPQVGLTAEVTALVQPDGSLLATHIQVEEPESVVTPTIGEPDDGAETEEEEEEAGDEEEAEEEDVEEGDEEDGGEDEGDDEDADEDGDEEDDDEVTAGEAAAAIADAQADIQEAQTAIDAAPEGVDISTAQEKVEEAEEKLAEAEALYVEGDYAAVVDKAEDAQQLAVDALDALSDATEDVEEDGEDGDSGSGSDDAETDVTESSGGSSEDPEEDI
ncbi:MAG: hypothetical protein HYX86_04775 [Chloroflexi bacterium]|nr:hypothetical protein [Chloroflexota bacterium]